MKVVIVGCGRVGSTLAENFDKNGHKVIIFDLRTSAFDRLPDSFKGTAIRGDGTDEEVLRTGGAEGADIFLALTEGDNRNIMSAQLAEETLGIPKVIAKINDPVRADAYADLGLATLCRTSLMVDAISEYLEVPIETGPGIKAPTGSHHHPDEPGHPPHAVIAEAPGVRPLARGGAAIPAEDSGVRAGQRGAEERQPADAAGTTDEQPARETRSFRRWRG